MQRLAGSVSKAERTASAVLNDLRLIKRVDTTAALRAEAASQLSALKAQRSALSRSILRIVKQDI